MSATMHDHLLLRMSEAVHSNVEVAVWSAESQLQDMCEYESSRSDKVSRFHSNKARGKEQCDLEAVLGGRERNKFGSASKASCNLCENERGLRAHVIENFLTLGMSGTVCRPGWPQMIVAVKYHTSLCESSVRAKKRKEAPYYRFICICSRICHPALTSLYCGLHHLLMKLLVFIVPA